MFGKILKKDKNEELEKVLEKKQIDEQAKNLLQGILYKIEVAYKDYQKVKTTEETEEQYVEQLILNIKKNCNKITIVKLNQKLADEELQKELKKNKYYVGKDEIISYPIEEKLLYAIEKKSTNDKILNNKYGYAIAEAVSNFINDGKNIDRIEVLRDFNGWSWTTIKKEIENIDANLVFQIIQILYGKGFLDNWIQDKDGIVDYFKIIPEKAIIELLMKIALANEGKTNEDLTSKIENKLQILDKELEKYEDTEANIEKISKHRKEKMEELKEIEKIIGQDSRLKAEYKKRNEDAPIEKKIFNIKVLKKELNDKKNKILNEISEDNYLLNPKNYMESKKQIKKEIENLQVVKYTKKQREKLLIEFIQEFLKCFNSKIAKTEKQEEILSLIYQFRYFMCLPFNLTQNVKDVDVIKEDVTKTEKQLVEKAIEKKVISDVPLEVMQHLFETRIVILEELYYRIETKDEKYYVQIFDDNITEEKFEVKSIGNIKTNKKLKIFI
ncbi:MAG: hypothetical protein BHW02_04220 [Clostridium sp. 28_12]|nr:MAG: hypothetical protein BHW02_04220 [Clostridium sp. 28_12]